MFTFVAVGFVMHVTTPLVEIECKECCCICFFLACTDTDCVKCPTGIAICTECSNGKGEDTSDNACKGKFFVLLKCDLFSSHNESYYFCYYFKQVL